MDGASHLMVAPMALERELKTYHDNLASWKENEGKFVLIRGEEVAGFFSSYEDAVKEGYSKYKLDPFLVKRVSAFEQVHVITRLIETCHTSHSN
jgi:hypothetical protein